MNEVYIHLLNCHQFDQTVQKNCKRRQHAPKATRQVKETCKWRGSIGKWNAETEGEEQRRGEWERQEKTWLGENKRQDGGKQWRHRLGGSSSNRSCTITMTGGGRQSYWEEVSTSLFPFSTSQWLINAFIVWSAQLRGRHTTKFLEKLGFAHYVQLPAQAANVHLTDSGAKETSKLRRF